MEHTPRSSLPLILCVAAGIGALCASQFGQGHPISYTEALPFYTQSVALVVALIAWHLSPRRSWAWLTVAGSLCAVPTLLLLLRDADLPEHEWWYEVITSSARSLLIVGLLGAATLVWRAGNQKAGAVLMGAVLTAPLVSTVTVMTAAAAAPTVVMVIGLALVALTVVLVSRAWSVPESTEPAASPGWRVTLAGAAAWVAIGIHQWWPAPDPNQANGTTDLLDQLKWQYLWIGLVLIGIGLVAGLVAGPRVLVAGLAGGLLLGSMTPMINSAWVELRILEPPSFLPVVVALAALTVGVLLARARARAMLGAGVLGALAVGLLVVYLVRDQDSSELAGVSFGDLSPFATVPLAIIVVGAVPVFASFGSALAPSGAAPAALVGVVAAIGFGISVITTYSISPTPVTYGTATGYPALMVCLVVVALLTVVATRQWARRDA